MARTRTTAALALLAAVVLVASTTVLGLRWWSANGAATEPHAATAEPGATASGEPGATASGEPRATPTAQASRPPVVRRVSAAPAPARTVSPPTRVRMAGIDIDLALRPVGVTTDGQMELPDEPWVLGWYRFGPAPGSGTGSVVLAGHLDSREYGVGPLVRLRQTSVGDTVEVTTGAGTRAAYRVVRVDRYDQQALPDELFDRTGPERLRVITCGGGYDPETGYEENLVVTAVPV